MKALYRGQREPKEMEDFVYEYKPNFLDLYAAHSPEIIEAKKRVTIIGKDVRYSPSKEYREAKRLYDLQRLRVRKTI